MLVGEGDRTGARAARGPFELKDGEVVGAHFEDAVGDVEGNLGPHHGPVAPQTEIVHPRDALRKGKFLG